MFLSSKLSAKEAQALAHSAQSTGAGGVEDMSRAGAHGRGNLCKDLFRSLSRRSKWPCLYWSKIPVLVDGIMIFELHPFLLPHETLATLVESNPDAALAVLPKQEASLRLQPEVAQWASRLHKDLANILVAGLHGDGVPFVCCQAERPLGACVLEHDGPSPWRQDYLRSCAQVVC